MARFPKKRFTRLAHGDVAIGKVERADTEKCRCLHVSCCDTLNLRLRNPAHPESIEQRLGPFERDIFHGDPREGIEDLLSHRGVDRWVVSVMQGSCDCDCVSVDALNLENFSSTTGHVTVRRMPGGGVRRVVKTALMDVNVIARAHSDA